MNINLEYYKIFYYVGKLKQITLAARELSISQPAVSQAMKTLENQLDTKLFLRTPKGIILTGEGELLFNYISKAYETILLGENKLMQMKNLDTGEVHIGASDMTLRFYLLPYLETFHQQYPGIKVSVSNAPTPETLRYLSEGKIDFGVVSTPLPSDCTAEIRVVKEIQDCFVAGERFSHLKKQKLQPKDLETLPLICLEKNTSTRRSMDEWLEREHVLLHPEFELATSDMIVQFAIRNLGVGCVMMEFAKEYIRQGALFPLRLTTAIPSRKFCVVMRKDVQIPTASGRLLSLLY